VARAVDAGLGRWLRGVDVVPFRPQGRFAGWRIRALHDGDACYRRVDLVPGDVVVRVNGKSVERPEEASDVFLELKTAPALEVEYLRDGAPRQLRLGIADD
jgi:type II secretory pathway component PulC